MQQKVGTPYYRAPEVMLEYHKYGTEIDMWSMGCILGELLGRKPLLQGRNTMDQLKLIVKVCTRQGSCSAHVSSTLLERRHRLYPLAI